MLLLSIGRLCSDPECLTYGREQRKPEHPEELEVDPELFAEIVDDVQVGGAEEREVRNPDVVQLSPERGVELDGVPEHPLREVLLSKELADEERGGEQPVHDGRFPLKKQRITESDRDRPQDDDQGGRDQQHVADLPFSGPLEGQEHRRRGHRRACRPIHSGDFVSHEEHDDGEKIDQ